MGGTSSTEIVYRDREIKVEVESEQSKQYRKMLQVDNQLEKIREEVSCLNPVITEGIKSGIKSNDSAVIVRHDGSTDRDAIVQNVEKFFPSNPCKNELVKSATNLLELINATRGVHDLLKWEKLVVYKKVKGNVYGFELQYKVRFLDELKGKVPGFRSNETTLLVAFKSALYLMDEDPHDFPDAEEVEAIQM
uniref:Uncharacterized protein n=1 Tax=Amphimedon queenslandica TaxID=400682 RepID=A0A1X7V6T1_AMPQE